jgi:hypothetical protein
MALIGLAPIVAYRAPLGRLLGLMLNLHRASVIPTLDNSDSGASATRSECDS